jgi:energy-coupling factor transporter ATP-binding protein EcfA2
VNDEVGFKMDDIVEMYSISELKDHTEFELLNLLKTAWNYSKAQPFDVIGRVKKIPTSFGGFFILEELRSTNDGSALLYPIRDTDVRHTVFAGPINAAQLVGQTVDGKWVIARVELSPEEKRIEQKNPFALKTVKGGIKLLQSIPEDITNIETIIDGEKYLEKWILDFYRDKHQKQIVEEGKKIHAQLEQEHQQEQIRVTKLKDEAEELIENLTNQKNSLHEVKKDLTIKRNLQSKTEAEFNQLKKKMEHELNKLQKFIEQKVNLLRELDLVDQEDVDGLLGRHIDQSRRDGHDFVEIFDSNIILTISYVQAHMWHKGVVYNREVLEDFYALLTTHDLIILAGDSGSGKTNLVKSFAEAIGGESVIVPVKPNWTSAEDLLGYYNPIEQKYLSTPFLDALFLAARNPDVPYFICLDEMNLARVEYYFADFLSLMEERGLPPKIYLYSDTEAGHLISEARNFLSLVEEAKLKLDKPDVSSFLELLRDEGLNAKLHELCGFREGDSLLKYHTRLRKLMSSYLTTPSAIRLPSNVRIIGTINVDETTHYLSPKILDRAHILRFASPLLADWSQVEDELEQFDLDLDLPVNLMIEALGDRVEYPTFDRNDSLVETLIHIVREYLEPIGIEFGLRTVRQARHYSKALQQFEVPENYILNNIILHKVLPKLIFDGEKTVDGSISRKHLLVNMRDFLDQRLTGLDDLDPVQRCVDELDRLIRNAQANDWVVNYWSR